MGMHRLAKQPNLPMPSLQGSPPCDSLVWCALLCIAGGRGRPGLRGRKGIEPQNLQGVLDGVFLLAHFVSLKGICGDARPNRGVTSRKSRQDV